MIEQTAQAAQDVIKIPVTYLLGFLGMVVGQLFLIGREVLKAKDFKSKNGILNEIRTSILKVAKDVEGMTSHCTTVSGQLQKQTDDNSKEILKLWKNRGKQPE